MGVRSKSIILEDRVYFQDPAFLNIGAEFLDYLAYTVIFDPEALDVISTTTFYFGIYAFKFLIRDLFEQQMPGLAVLSPLGVKDFGFWSMDKDHCIPRKAELYRGFL